MSTEAVIQTQIMDTLAGRFGLTLWRNNSGSARKGKCWVRYGLARGSADLIGIAAPMGRFVALEVKAPGEHADPHQIAWLDNVRASGGIAAVVHSVEEALLAVRLAEVNRYEADAYRVAEPVTGDKR